MSIRTATATFLLAFLAAEAWVTPPSTLHHESPSSTCLFDSDDMYFGDYQPPMTLSANDLDRLGKLRDRQKVVSLFLVETALLPGQTMEMGSSDHKFFKFVQGLDPDASDLGVLGSHPYNRGQPLTVGTFVEIKGVSIQGNTCVLKVEGKDRFDVQGNAKWDKTDSCFKAHVEQVDDEVRGRLADEDYKQAQDWYNEIPNLMEKWCKAMKSTGRATQEDLEARHWEGESSSWKDCAYAAAAMLNPSKPWDSPVCLEIRPALLACRNDYDRLNLVQSALQASIQHITSAGDSQLF